MYIYIYILVLLYCHCFKFRSWHHLVQRGDADLRRRRSVPEPPYGYANRPQMMNNYGGTMPQQTPYGYSGWNDGPDGCISS